MRVTFFKAAHGLNPELEARHAANRLGLTRQLRFSPKNEKSLDVTLSVNGEFFHRYTMRQAIEERFIMDVLRHYTTYTAYYKLLKACADDPHVERKKAAKALARFLRLHPHNIAQKTEIVVEHFNTMTRHKIGGKAKAMVVTGSRLESVPASCGKITFRYPR